MTRKAKYTHLWCLVLAVLAAAAAAWAQTPRMAGFSLFTHAFLDPEHRPSILVSVNVPYTSLIFLRETGTFRSEYAVYIKILDKKKRLVETAVINESVAVEDYRSTRSAKMSTGTSKRFQLEPGSYIVQCAVQVKNTRRYFEREALVEVPRFLEAGIGVGKPRLFATEIEITGGTGRLADATGEAFESGAVFPDGPGIPAGSIDSSLLGTISYDAYDVAG